MYSTGLQYLAQEEFFFLVTTTAAVDLAQRFNVCGPMRGSVAGRHQGAIGGQGRCAITVGAGMVTDAILSLFTEPIMHQSCTMY